MNTNDFIESARKLFKPTPVIKHKIPSWMQSRILKLKKDGVLESPYTRAYDLIYDAAASVGLRLDHWGKIKSPSKVACGEVFVNEPYPYWFQHSESEKFAELLGCNVDTFPVSWHFPGRTFRVVFYPSDWGHGFNPCAFDEFEYELD